MTQLSRFSVYIDTSVLGNWILYYRNRDALKDAEKRVTESFRLLHEIEKNNLRCSFFSSTWAIAELADVVIEKMLYEKMAKACIPLSQFPSQRRVFEVKDEIVKKAISENVADFSKFLSNINIRIRSFEIDEDSVIDLMLKHTFLSSPDALHLSFAVRSCDFFVTLDTRHFLESKHGKEIEDIDGIKIFRPSELVKHFQKLSIITVHAKVE